jgi:DNA-binding LytR/AlgR family response regulator
MLLREHVKILIVEDQDGFAQLIQMMLEELNLKNICKAHTMEKAWALFEKERPDLCLIDIELSDKKMEGIALAEKIREVSPALPIIYITVHYNEEIYERCKHTLPSSFMNKELSRLKVYQAVELALMNVSQTDRSPSSTDGQNLPTETKVPWIDNRHFFFKVGDVYKHIPVEEIAFFYAKGKMTFARVNKRNFPTNVQLKTLEDELHPQFLRIHKSYLVNASAIDSINLKDSLIEVAEERLPIGYAYRKDFMNRLKILK